MIQCVNQPGRLWFSKDLHSIMHANVIIYSKLLEKHSHVFTEDEIGRSLDLLISGIDNLPDPIAFQSTQTEAILLLQAAASISKRVKSVTDRVRLMNALVPINYKTDPISCNKGRQY